MNPTPPPNKTANYPRDPMALPPQGPYAGDKIYVAIDALLTLGGFGLMFAMAPQLVEESMRQQASRGGPKADPAMVQNIMYAAFGCGAVVCIPIMILLWVYMIKGKVWAFIVGVILAVLGLLNGIYSVLTSPVIAIGIFGLVTSLARTGYLGGRMAGLIGPKPN